MYVGKSAWKHILTMHNNSATYCGWDFEARLE